LPQRPLVLTQVAFFRWSARRTVSKACGTGLRQFESTFTKKWEPRYAAAEQRKIHNFDEYYELALKQAL
jgi:hypothetical protein